MEAKTFNYFEVVVWFLFSLVLLISALKNGKRSPFFYNQLIASVFFLLFSVSDLIEVYTGAWWRPFWLLLLKSICIIAFVWCGYQYVRIKKGILGENGIIDKIK